MAALPRLNIVKPALLCLISCCAWAQLPRIGDINLYGFDKVSAQKILSTAGVAEGDPLPASKGEVEDRIADLPGVVEARLEVMCCGADGRAMLFIGVEEKGAPHFALRSAPSGNTTLPKEVSTAYRQYVESVRDAVRQGNAAAPPEKFAGLADRYLAQLRECLHTCPQGEERAMAAALIGSGAKKQDVVNDLQFALQDPDEGVRAEAMRTLSGLALLSIRDPALRLKIPGTWFVEMLNSLAANDRIKASEVLVTLTETGGDAVLEQIHTRALAAVVQMAQWKSLRYALPAFILAGRMAGLKEARILEAWEAGRREEVLELLKGGRKKR